MALGDIMTQVQGEVRRERMERTRKSRQRARKLQSEVELNGMRIIVNGRGPANWFFAEIGGRVCGIAAFASHEGWWEKPSLGFRRALAAHPGRWGVVLFDANGPNGTWIEGPDFDENVLRAHKKVTAADVKLAHRARLFTETRELLAFLSSS